MDAAQAQEFIDRLTGSCVGGWLLERPLGAGKSAVVMKGSKGGVEAAVKVFHRELIERFGREMQLERVGRETTLVGSSHPNLVEILGGGACESSGDIYVVMELLPWENLKVARSSVPPESIPAVIRQLAAAAEHLESLGLVHRDIKPENVAISPDRAHVKLLDLGVIKPFGISGLTDITSKPFIGTLQYSSPEHLLREEDGSIEGWRALSFYQLGAVLHDLLMQKELFSDCIEPFSRLVRAVTDDVPDVFGGDPRLVALCKYCLVKDPDTRLKLLSWASFDVNRENRENLFQTVERVRLRRDYELSKVGRAGQTLAGERSRLMKRLLDSACERLCFQISLSNKMSGALPLCSISPSVSIADHTCSCLMTYERDAGRGLDLVMRMELKLWLVDENSGDPIFKLEGSILHLPHGGSSVSKIAIGNLSDVLSEVRLSAWLITVLDSTYNYVDAQGGA